MNCDTGQIKEIRGNKIAIEAKPISFCKGCEARNECSIAKATVKNRIIWLEYQGTEELSVGDVVEFKVSQKGVVISSLLLYLMPLLLLLIGAFLGSVLAQALSFDREDGAALGGIVGLLLSFGFLWIFSKKTKGKNILAPEIVKVLQKKQEEI